MIKGMRTEYTCGIQYNIILLVYIILPSGSSCGHIRHSYKHEVNLNEKDVDIERRIKETEKKETGCIFTDMTIEQTCWVGEEALENPSLSIKSDIESEPRRSW